MFSTMILAFPESEEEMFHDAVDDFNTTDDPDDRKSGSSRQGSFDDNDRAIFSAEIVTPRNDAVCIF